jgi:hypothetical protein
MGSMGCAGDAARLGSRTFLRGVPQPNRASAGSCYANVAMIKRTTSRRRIALLAAVLGVLGAGVALADPNPEEANRYPYDPVCAWGRIANGKGMLVRCIEQAEASALLARVATTTPPVATGSASASASAATEEPPPGQDMPLSARLVRVTADEGKLPVAEKKLDVPRDRYVDCVKKNGGLTADKGEVHVRFLVRVRGRAEGVSVAKRNGVSAKAATCIADVVDRRAVGTPDAPMVGATAVIEIARAK